MATRDIVEIDNDMRTLQLQKAVSLSRKVMAEESKTKLDTNRASGTVSPINFNTYQNIIEHEQTKIQDILNRLMELRRERYSAVREARTTGRISPFFETPATSADIPFTPIEPNNESSIINNGNNFTENNGNRFNEDVFSEMNAGGGKKKSKRKRSKSKSKTRKVKKGKGKTFKKKQRKTKRKTKRIRKRKV
jgi:hypothetical protein